MWAEEEEKTACWLSSCEEAEADIAHLFFGLARLFDSHARRGCRGNITVHHDPRQAVAAVARALSKEACGRAMEP